MSHVCFRAHTHKGFGGDTMMDHNLFFRSLLETSDHGPYNSVCTQVTHIDTHTPLNH
jgi:hypothetical protein